MCLFKFFIILVLINAGLVTAESQVIVLSSSLCECSPHCPTLFDFANRTLQMELSDNTTLILEPGNHSLQLPLTIANTNTFVMHSRTKDFDVLITCNQSGTFKFVNVSLVQILNLTFLGCGNTYKAMFEFRFVESGVIDQCSMRYSEGSIIHLYQSNVKIANTLLTNTSSKNGAISLEASTISITHSIIINNTFQNHGAIYASNKCILNISQSIFTNNVVKKSALLWAQSSFLLFHKSIMIANNECVLGVLFTSNSLIQSSNILSIIANKATLHNVYIAQSEIVLTGELLYSGNHGTLLIIETHAVFSGMNTFAFCTSTKWAGALTGIQSTIIVTGIALFHNNSARIGGAVGMYGSKLYINGELNVVNNTAYRNGSGAYLYQSELLCQVQCTFLNNLAYDSGGGIYAVGSSVIVGRKVWTNSGPQISSLNIIKNKAHKGGGISLKSYSKIYGIGEEGHFYRIYFFRNFATYGGGIFVDDESNADICTSKFSQYEASTHCLLQTLFYTPYESVAFVKNQAQIAGSVLFGGLLDRCTVGHFSHTYEDRHIMQAASSETSTPSYGVDYFQNVTNISDLSLIDSHAVRVCQCIQNKPRCDLGQHSILQAKKGEKFDVTIVAVNQVNKTVNSSLFSYTQSSKGHLGKAQYLKNISNVCTTMTFNVYSPFIESDSLVIYARGPCRGMGISPVIFKVIFNECLCPIGFEVSSTSKYSCECKCHHEVQTFAKQCNIKEGSFFREDTFWIEHVNYSGHQGYITYPYCPFDYCHPSKPGVWINLNVANGADNQCAEHRTGLLCGACKPGYSISVGSSHCITCHGWFKVSTVLFCLGVLILGIALVGLILFLNLTVAVGTINGVVFYANIIAANGSLFLPFSQPNMFTVFIAWLNLSIGFDMCFYTGLNEYIKVWLLFIFPIYLITLVVAVILLSGYSSKFASMIGKKNPVATLATLILFSYTKFLQIVIKILSFTILKYPDGSKQFVWLPDANVQFLEAKHVPLFLIAVLFTCVGLAYIIILFLWQWIQKIPITRTTSWIANAKFNSFICTYHLPYKANHRYWTGLLLLARVILYLVAAVDVSGDPRFGSLQSA